MESGGKMPPKGGYVNSLVVAGGLKCKKNAYSNWVD